MTWHCFITLPSSNHPRHHSWLVEPSAAPGRAIGNSWWTWIPHNTETGLDDMLSTITFGIHKKKLKTHSNFWEIRYYNYSPYKTKILDENVPCTQNRVWTRCWKNTCYQPPQVFGWSASTDVLSRSLAFHTLLNCAIAILGHSGLFSFLCRKQEECRTAAAAWQEGIISAHRKL